MCLILHTTQRIRWLSHAITVYSPSFAAALPLSASKCNSAVLRQWTRFWVAFKIILQYTLQPAKQFGPRNTKLSYPSFRMGGKIIIDRSVWWLFALPHLQKLERPMGRLWCSAAYYVHVTRQSTWWLKITRTVAAPARTPLRLAAAGNAQQLPPQMLSILAHEPGLPILID